jgi:dihydrofolate reductase
MSRISIIGAFGRKGVYGTTDGKIPWKSSRDMEWFKDHTTGGTIIMGRKTWESLPPKFRPLPNRESIVLTSDANYALPEGVLKASSLEVAIALATRSEVFLIGGESVWIQGLPLASRALITEVGWLVPSGSEQEYLSLNIPLTGEYLSQLGFVEETSNTRINEGLGGGKTGMLTFATHVRR